MTISILVLVGLVAAALVIGIVIGWNNSKSSLTAKLDAEIGKATGAAQQTLASFKAKL